MNDKIKELNAEIEREKKRIANCPHNFNKPFSNPEEIKVPYGSVQVGQGSDPWWEPLGYRDDIKPRWTRICADCGQEEHTYTQKPIVVGNEPDFN